MSTADPFSIRTDRALESAARWKSRQKREGSLLLIGSLGLGLSFAWLCHGLIDRHASFSEFVSRASGIAAVSGTFLSLFINPLWRLISKDKSKQREIVLTADGLVSAGASRLIAFMFLTALLCVALNVYLQSKPTRFDVEFERLMALIHDEALVEAETKLARLKAAGPRIKYETDLLRLADLGVKTQRGWLARSLSADEWNRLRAEIADWHDSTGADRRFDVLLLVALAQLAQADHDHAETNLRVVLQDSHDSRTRAVAAIRLGELLLANRSYPDALGAYQLALALGQGMPNERLAIIRRKTGICKALLRDWEGAIREFEAALSIAEASRPIVLSNLGFALTAAREFEKAIQTLKHAIELSPLDPVPYMNLAIAHAESRSFGQAKDSLQLAWERTSKSTINAGYSSNEVLVRLLQAWVQLRENPAYWTGVAQYIRQSQGLPPVPAEIADVVNDKQRLAQAYIDAASSILRHQNLHGLEFIAYDFLREIPKITDDAAIAKVREEAIQILPLAATARREMSP